MGQLVNARATVPQCVQLGCARLNCHSSEVIVSVIEMLGYELGYW